MSGPCYFDQTRQDLNDSSTILEEVWQSYPNLKETELRNMLAAFLFYGDDVFKLISSLSGRPTHLTLEIDVIQL